MRHPEWPRDHNCEGERKDEIDLMIENNADSIEDIGVRRECVSAREGDEIKTINKCLTATGGGLLRCAGNGLAGTKERRRSHNNGTEKTKHVKIRKSHLQLLLLIQEDLEAQEGLAVFVISLLFIFILR